MTKLYRAWAILWEDGPGELSKEVINYVSGRVAHSYNFAVMKATDVIRRFLGASVLIVDRYEKRVGDSTYDVGIVRIDETDADARRSSKIDVRSAQYHTVFLPGDSAFSERFVLPRPFEQVEFELVDVQNVKRATIRADSGGEVKETSFQIPDDVEYMSPPDVLPVRFEFDEPVSEVEISVSIDLGDEQHSSLKKFLDAKGFSNYKFEDLPLIGVPTFRHRSNPPIFLISVDAFNYDFIEEFEGVLDKLGPSVSVPSEPRSQAGRTDQSHAALFTGVFPSVHGNHEATWKANMISSKINDGLTTIGDFLYDHGYKNSALVSHTRILPEFGFGRGFSRYELQQMGFTNRDLEPRNDARSRMDTLLRWIDTDAERNGNNLLYFLHVFDPHAPYSPTLPLSAMVDLDMVAMHQMHVINGDDYLDPHSIENPPIDPEILSKNIGYYRQELGHVSTQVERLLDNLRKNDMLKESFIVIFGDHGEEFLEKGRNKRHSSVNDSSVRPGMIVKPPDSADWDVPEDPDLIDVFPTIARALNEEPPPQCQGRAWQDRRGDVVPRIAEDIKDRYTIAVEYDGAKGIFEYDHTDGVPSETDVNHGPLREEYIELSVVRADGYGAEGVTDVAEMQKEVLKTIAEDHIRSIDPPQRIESSTAITPSQQTEAQLEFLGYR